MAVRATADGAGGVIFALIAGVMIQGLAKGCTYPLLGILLAGRVESFWNGVSAAGTGLGFLLGVALVPPFARRFGSGTTALCGVLLMLLSLAALSVVRDFAAIFALRLLLGCAANMLFIVAETGLNVFVAPARRGRVIGLYAAGGALGYVIGPTVVAALPEAPGLLLLGCAAVVGLAVLPLGRVRAPLDRAVAPASAAGLLPAVRAFPFVFALLFGAAAIDAVVLGLLPVIALEQAFPLQLGALFVAVFHVGLLLGQPLVGLCLDRLGRRRTVLGCCLLSLACAGGLVLGERLGFWPAAALMFLWGASNYGLYTAGLALIGDRFRGEALSAATTAFAAVYALAAIAAPLLAGQALESVGAAGFYLAIAGFYLSALVIGAVRFRPFEPTAGRAAGG